MHLQNTIMLLYAGGPGSGCNPDKGKCGRPRTSARQGSPVDSPRIRELTQQLEQLNTELSGRMQKKDRALTEVVKRGVEQEIYRLSKPPRRERIEIVTPGKGSTGRFVTDRVVIETPSKRVTQQRYTLPGGVQYTLLKPKEQRDRTTSVERPKMRHVLHGRFSKTVSFNSKIIAGLNSTLFEADRPFGKQGEGTTLLVYRDRVKKRMSVVEFSRGEYAYLTRTRVFKFRNIGEGSGFLKRRYGASLTLPRGL
jgi:hypothetical protein